MKLIYKVYLGNDERSVLYFDKHETKSEFIELMEKYDINDDTVDWSEDYYDDVRCRHGRVFDNCEEALQYIGLNKKIDQFKEETMKENILNKLDTAEKDFLTKFFR